MSIIRKIPAALVPGLLVVAPPAHAEPSTQGGAISVAQVTHMLDQASGNRTARQVLTAYLAGVGEAVGAVVDLGGADCRRPLSLSAQDARRAIAAESAGKAGTSAATPLIVGDMLARAGCRRP
jgi:ABC-type amino acid transport substrate-binding protein